MTNKSVFLAAALAVPYTGLDCHVHVHPDGGGDMAYDGARVLTAVRSVGLSHACILSQGYQRPYDPKREQKEFTLSRNDWTLGEAKKHPTLLPFCGVPVLAEWAAEEVARCVSQGARGLKLHQNSEGFSLGNEPGASAFRKVVKAAQDKIPILIHVKFDDAEIRAFYAIVKEFPATKFIVAHNLGPKFALLKEAPKNVYVDVSGILMAPPAAGARFVAVWKEIGLNRILFASDWPVYHPVENLHSLAGYPLTPEELTKIRRDNAREIFGDLGN